MLIFSRFVSFHSHSGMSGTVFAELRTMIEAERSRFPGDIIVVSGDFNGHLFGGSGSIFDNLFTNFDLGLRRDGYVRFPETEAVTYRNGAHRSTLDYIFTCGVVSSSFVVHRRFITQHRPIGLTFEIPTCNNLNQNLAVSFSSFRLKKGRSVEDIQNALSVLLQEFEHVPLLNIDVNLLWEKVLAIFEKFCGRSQRLNRVFASDPWQKFLESREKTELEKVTLDFEQASVLADSHGSLVHVQSANELHVQLEALIDDLKSKAAARILKKNENSMNSHSTGWTTLSKLKKSSQNVPIPPGKLLDHFKSLFAKGSPIIPLPTTPPPIGPPTHDVLFFDNCFTEEEVSSGIRNLNQSAACGPDGISVLLFRSIFLQNQFEAPLKLLTIIYNAVFAQSKVPKNWNESEMFIKMNPK